MEVEENIEQQVETNELNKITASEIVLGKALAVNGVIKGIAETIKALESGKVQMVFLAEDCDNDQYKETVIALANQYNVKVIDIPTWIELKDFCKLGMQSSTIIKIAEDKGKEPKIKPRCSCAAIVEWGDEQEARDYLIKNE